MDKIPMTKSGLNELEKELKLLKSVERPAVIRAIAEAREHGDLKENAEYHAAREKQSFIEGRLKELEVIISHAEAIDISKFIGDDVVRFGATVLLADQDTEEEITYQIVGSHESDIKTGKLSVTSPLGRALVAKELGDTVEVNTPKGSKSYEIVKIDYC